MPRPQIMAPKANSLNGKTPSCNPNKLEGLHLGVESPNYRLSAVMLLKPGENPNLGFLGSLGSPFSAAGSITAASDAVLQTAGFPGSADAAACSAVSAELLGGSVVAAAASAVAAARAADARGHPRPRRFHFEHSRRHVHISPGRGAGGDDECDGEGAQPECRRICPWCLLSLVSSWGSPAWINGPARRRRNPLVSLWLVSS